jgi:peptide/nickel transport system permease protein
MHLIVPVIVIGTSGMAGWCAAARQPAGRAGQALCHHGLRQGRAPTGGDPLYPLRMALNPFVADIGNLLPSLVSGSVLVSLVVGLQTIGPILLSALRSQDYFLSGFILMFVSLLTLVGMLVSDLLLAWLDPRIRYSGRAGMSRIPDPPRPGRHYVSDEPYDPGPRRCGGTERPTSTRRPGC